MTSKEWRSFLRSQAKHGRPDDIEVQFISDLAAAEARIAKLVAVLTSMRQDAASIEEPYVMEWDAKKVIVEIDAALDGAKEVPRE